MWLSMRGEAYLQFPVTKKWMGHCNIPFCRLPVYVWLIGYKTLWRDNKVFLKCVGVNLKQENICKSFTTVPTPYKRPMLPPQFFKCGTELSKFSLVNS